LYIQITETTSSLAKEMTDHPQKVGLTCTWHIFLCTTVDLQKFCHGTS